MLRLIKRLAKDKRGQSLVEYALILALVSIVCIFALTTLGGQVKDMFEDISTALGATMTTP